MYWRTLRPRRDRYGSTGSESVDTGYQSLCFVARGPRRCGRLEGQVQDLTRGKDPAISKRFAGSRPLAGLTPPMRAPKFQRTGSTTGIVRAGSVLVDPAVADGAQVVLLAPAEHSEQYPRDAQEDGNAAADEESYGHV